VFEAMRKIVAGGAVSYSALWLGGGLAALYIVLAGWFFRSIHRYVVRTGLIARYSAESLS
jgi:ABC-2 type transport system permease protein